MTLDEEANSIGVIIKHMAGNMISRWTDFLNSDGEKPDRNRDMEFVLAPDMAKADLIAHWERGWAQVFEAIESLRPEDLARSVHIRGKAHTVVEAINRQLTHYAYHVGQIVLLAKHLRSTEWQSLSIPRNRSAQFNAYLAQATVGADDSSRRSRFDEPQDFIRDSENERP
jgi:methionyl-tRNA formyltransferase